MDDKVTAKLRACQTLPSLPAVAIELVRQCRSDDFDVRRVSDLVSRDPALAAKVLKVANSSAFQGSGKVATISSAFMRLGANTVMTLALSFSLARTRKSTKGGFDHERYWRYALLCATATKILSKRISGNAEEMFLVGLFQDIGMLALSEVSKTVYTTLLRDAGDDHLRLERLEQERLGTDHIEVGAWLAQQWNLPDFIVASTLGSHSPVRADGVPGDRSPVTACVALSRWIADVWMLKDAPAASRFGAERAKMLLGMDRPAFQEVLFEVGEAVPVLSDLFDIRVAAAESIKKIVDEARDALVLVSLRSAQDVHRSAQMAHTLEQKLQRDALTGLFNRAYLDNSLNLAFENAMDFGRPLSVLFCDIDFFKNVNDTYGHLAGDQALEAVARVLSGSVRQLDIVARYGGEEFVVLLPGTDETGAHVVADRIRQRVQALQVPTPAGDGTIPLTVSVGFVTHGPKWRASDVSQLLGTADLCLYAAKEGGRNKVVSYDPEHPLATSMPSSRRVVHRSIPEKGPSKGD